MPNNMERPALHAPHRLARPLSLSHHERRCAICRHPDREDIEQDFLHWRSPTEIFLEHNLANRAVVYRHAHAAGLFVRRRRNLRWAFEYVLERAEEATVTAHSLVRAARAYSQISDDGQWIEPPKRAIITYEVVRGKASAVPQPGDEELQFPGNPLIDNKGDRTRI